RRIADARLRRQVHHPRRLVGGKGLLHRLAVRQVGGDVGIARLVQQPRQARLLQAGVVVLVEVVNADDLVAALEQPQSHVGSDEAGGAGDENLHLLNSSNQFRLPAGATASSTSSIRPASTSRENCGAQAWARSRNRASSPGLSARVAMASAMAGGFSGGTHKPAPVLRTIPVGSPSGRPSSTGTPMRQDSNNSERVTVAPPGVARTGTT